METKTTKFESDGDSNLKKKKGIEIEGYPVEGLSIGGQETCVIFPSLKLAFDIGRCPQRAISQDFLFISHAHMDHIELLRSHIAQLWARDGFINSWAPFPRKPVFKGEFYPWIHNRNACVFKLGGLPMYVATRGFYSMKPPTIIVPAAIKNDVERLFEVHRQMDKSELKHNLIGLNVGEEYKLRKGLKVRTFRTYHCIPSQGYVIYSVREKLKQEFVGLSGDEIKKLKFSGVEITYTVTMPEIAFTGDTMSDFIGDDTNSDVLKARVLVMESTFVDDAMTVENARDYGHTHLSEIVSHADKFENKAILLIHFSARYRAEEIQEAVSALPPPLAGRVFALTEGF